MGELVELFKKFDRYKSIQQNELILYLIPSIELKQYMRIYDKGELVGFANWAYLHDLVEKRFIKNGKLKSNEWKSGNNIWLIEIVSIRNTRELTKKLYNHFKERIAVGKSVKWLRVDKKIYRVGEKFKREFHS